MSGRIRGHYRIDSAGRVESLGDVNALATPFTLPLSVMRGSGRGHFHLVHVSIFGGVLLMLGMGLMAALPQIQRAVISAEAAHSASERASYIHSHPALQALLAKKH